MEICLYITWRNFNKLSVIELNHMVVEVMSEKVGAVDMWYKSPWTILEKGLKVFASWIELN